MCKPISFCQDREGNIYHLHPELWAAGPFDAVVVRCTPPLDGDTAGSHTDICRAFELPEDDRIAKYEAALDDGGAFSVDYSNLSSWHTGVARRWAASLRLSEQHVLERIANEANDLNTAFVAAQQVENTSLIPELRLGMRLREAVHPVHPLHIEPRLVDVPALVKQWASVRDSVWDSVRDSVRDSVWDSVWASVGDSVRDSVGDSVRDSVWDSVWASVGDSVWASVWASVGDSVGDSVWDSVRDSVWDSVWASVGAYIGSLFPGITEWRYAEHLGPNPWQPLRELWLAGYVPYTDGKAWFVQTKNGSQRIEW